MAGVRWTLVLPQACEIAEWAEEAGQNDQAAAVRQAIGEILARPEHQWYEDDPASGNPKE